MMHFILLAFIVANVVVFVVDLTDFPNSVKKWLSWAMTKGKIVKTDYRLHLLDCSLCLTFWSNMLLSVVLGCFGVISIGICCFFAYLTPVIGAAMLFIRDLMLTAIDWLNNKLIQ